MARTSSSAERFKYGICLNDECPLCKSKKVQQLPMRKDMICEECKKPLRECPPPPPPPIRLIAIIIATVLGLAGAGFGAYKLIGGSPEIDKIKLEPKSLALVIGQKDVVKATVVDKDGNEIKDAKVTYKWTVKDEKIASVTQGGEVAALKKGKTAITVKIEGDDQHRATCQIEVDTDSIDKEVLITSLSVDNTSISLKEGEQKELTVNVEPANFTEDLAAESSNPEVAVVENSVIIAKKAGKAKIVIKAEKSGKSATINVIVTKETTGPGPEGDPSKGTLHLSYGTYTGETKNGYPNGQGSLVYSTSRQISKYDSKGRTAQAGESVQGTFKNGFFTIGKHYDASGNLIESLNIGSPVEGVYESK